MFKYENTTTRTRLKNRLDILLHTVRASYTHFSDRYLLILMTIYNFRYLHITLHDVEEHCTLLANFRYIIVYIFWGLQAIFDVYLQIFSCFSEIQNNQIK